MKKSFLFYLTVLFLGLFFLNGFLNNQAFAFKKKEKPVLILSSRNFIGEINLDERLKEKSVFKTNERIYFYLYNPLGFKSNYIKYQIVKQDDNAHVGGYTRIRNLTRRVSDKFNYCDYFVLSQKGKYIIQIFDIENLHQWITFGNFLVVEE